MVRRTRGCRQRASETEEREREKSKKWSCLMKRGRGRQGHGEEQREAVVWNNVPGPPLGWEEGATTADEEERER